MNSIQEVVNAKVQEMIDGGEIEKKIQESIQSSIESAIESQFKSYGNITKQIEKVFEEGLKIDAKYVQFDTYNQVMLSAIKTKLNEYFAAESSAKFMDQLDEMFQPAPKEMDIHDFVESIASKWKEDNETYYDWENYAHAELTQGERPVNGYNLKMYVESTGFRSSKEKELHLYIREDGQIRISRRMKYNPTCMFGDDAFVFRLYAAGTKLTNIDNFDSDDCDLHVGIDEDC